MRRIPIAVAVLALALAGCGGSSGENKQTNTTGGSSPASTPANSGGATTSGGLQLAAPADGSLKFDKTTLTAKAGSVIIDFNNPSTTPHGIAIQGNGVQTSSQTVTNAKTSVTADLKPGTYTFYCPVPGHEQAGMKGTLTVK